MGSDSIDISLAVGVSLTRSYRYDASGNRTRACSGNTCTVYSYGGNGAGPHAVSAVNGNASGYAYNASGEMTKDNGRSLTWSAFGKALSITRGNTTVTLRYGPGNRRTRKTVTGPLSETVTYLGSAERLDINGRVSIRRTLGIAGIAIIDTGGAQSKRLYPIADHLGSTIAIADSSGHLVQGLAYADFGQRYSAGWGAALTTAQALSVNTTLSDRGYTGQESLDAIGLDDYNARLYDPSLGRFLSVDPLIGHPGSTQGINPYSYVANNPLNRTDPTGESSCSGTSRTCVTMPMGNIKTKNVKSISINTKTGKVTATLTNGKTVSGSLSTSQAAATAAGAVAMFGTSVLHGQGITGQNPQKTADHTKITNQQKNLAGMIYNEVGSYRPQNGKDGKPDAASSKSLSNGREAIGKVILNREAAGKTGGVAPSGVIKQARETPQYTDSLAAAKKAIAVGGSQTGPQHFYLRSGKLTIVKGEVIAGNQPSWGKGVVPVASYGPFRNPIKVGDVAAGNDVYIDIYNVP